MLALVAGGLEGGGVGDLEVVWLGEGVACASEGVVAFTLEGLAEDEVDMVSTDDAVVGYGVLDEAVGVLTVGLVEVLVLFGEVVTVAGVEGGYENLVLGVGLAVGEVGFVVDLVVIVLVANHVHDVDIGGASDDEAVDLGVARDVVVGHEDVGHGEVAVLADVVGAVAVVVVVVVGCAGVVVVEAPGALIVGLDGRREEEGGAEDWVLRAVEALDVLGGVGECHVVLCAVAIEYACLELDELDVHVVVDASCEAVVVRASSFHSAVLLEVVEGYVVGVVFAAAAHGDVVVHAEAGLEDLIKPVGVDLAEEVVLVAFDITGRDVILEVIVGVGLYDILGVLLGVHDIVYSAGYLVHTDVAGVVDAHGLVLGAALGGYDDDAVGRAGAVDSSCGGIFEHLDGLDVVRREVADGGAHRYAVDDIERCGAIEGAEATDFDCGVGARLTVGCDLYAGGFTLQHCGDVGVGDLLEVFGIDH